MARTKSRTNPPRQNLAKYLFIWCAAAAAVCSRFHPVSFASDDTNHRQPRQHLLLPSLLPPPLPTTTTTLLFHNPAGLFGRRSNPATYLRGHPGPTFSSMAVLPLPFHHPIATHPGTKAVAILEQGSEKNDDDAEEARFRSALVSRGRLENPMTWRESESNHLGRADADASGRVGGCCFRVKVGFTRGQRGGAFKLHPYMFTYYRMEPGMINGRNHYTSEDGRFAISYCGDSYWIQRADTRGECKGWAHSGWRGNTCVEDIEYTYRYYIPSIEEFIPANKGLSIWCKS